MAVGIQKIFTVILKKCNIPRSVLFPLILLVAHIVAGIGLAGAEAARVPLQYLDLYYAVRIGSSVLSIFSIIYLLRRGFDDFLYAFFSINLLGYTLFLGWFLPFYEFIFFQSAIAFAFFRVSRKWLYYLIFSLGFVALISSYYIQASIQWPVPQLEFFDQAFVLIVCFLVALSIRYYVLSETQKKEDLYLQFGIVGREATRLLHDVKGMLSSPLLVSGGLVHKLDEMSDREKKLAIVELHTNLENIRNVVYNLNRLSMGTHELEETSFRNIFERATSALRPRLQGVEFNLAIDCNLKVETALLESVVFNLVLNTVQAQNLKKTASPRIEVRCEEGGIFYSDNVGSAGALKDEFSSSLGRVLILDSIHKMGFSFSDQLTLSSYSASIYFKK